MITKLILGSMLGLGLMLSSVIGATEQSTGCCSPKSACCSPASACCTADSKAGCCQKDSKCCAEKSACCSASQPHSTQGCDKLPYHDRQDSKLLREGFGLLHRKVSML